MELTPLQDILELKCHDGGHFSLTFPPSVCFGVVTLGGLLVTVSHRAARQFIAAHPTSQKHGNLLHSSVYFFRPALASPRLTNIAVSLTNSSRIWTTAHVELSQDGKVCMAGYMTFSDLGLHGPISASTGWKLTPPPLPADLSSLEADDDPQWVSYLTPLSEESIRNVQAYVKSYFPIERRDTNTLDQWITPAWEGGRWTDELIHFVIDNRFPYWQNYLPDGVMPYCRYDALIAAGLEQRRARREHRDDRIFGDGCGPAGPPDWMGASVSITTEVKKPIPKEGSAWLFMRSFTVAFENNRFDEQTYLMDVHGDVVAISHHHIHVIPTASKVTRKQPKL